MSDQDSEKYEHFGTYQNWEAKQLLNAFDQENIRFDFAEDAREMKNAGKFMAQSGGTFGAGVGLAIYVHPQDVERAVAVRGRIFKIEV